MPELLINHIYRIELCSGEQRQWQYLGRDSRRLIWWMDVETRQEFTEDSLMYAWKILADASSVQGMAQPPD